MPIFPYRDEGPEGTFRAFCEAQYPLLVGILCVRVHDRFEAEDLAQEALARTWLAWKRVSGLERPDLWTRKVAINLARSLWRRRQLSHRVQSAAAADEKARRSDRQGANPALLVAVRRLPPRQQEAVALRFYAGMSVAEAAAAMGCREGTVKALTSQAMVTLRGTLVSNREVRNDR
jgi:RNA polymerase sigma-70 factor (sigma-E family)